LHRREKARDCISNGAFWTCGGGASRNEWGGGSSRVIQIKTFKKELGKWVSAGNNQKASTEAKIKEDPSGVGEIRGMGLGGVVGGWVGRGGVSSGALQEKALSSRKKGTKKSNSNPDTTTPGMPDETSKGWEKRSARTQTFPKKGPIGSGARVKFSIKKSLFPEPGTTQRSLELKSTWSVENKAGAWLNQC